MVEADALCEVCGQALCPACIDYLAELHDEWSALMAQADRNRPELARF